MFLFILYTMIYIQLRHDCEIIDKTHRLNLLQIISIKLKTAIPNPYFNEKDKNEKDIVEKSVCLRHRVKQISTS